MLSTKYCLKIRVRPGCCTECCTVYWSLQCLPLRSRSPHNAKHFTSYNYCRYAIIVSQASRIFCVRMRLERGGKGGKEKIRLVTIARFSFRLPDLWQSNEISAAMFFCLFFGYNIILIKYNKKETIRNCNKV